jgi:DNA modification methylase
MEYYELLKRLNNKPSSEVLERDARNTGLESNSVDLIVTSPPYATSYEYADLHQLTLLWFGFTNDMMKTKRKFIGTSVNSNMDKLTDSQLANKIVRSLKNRDKHLAGQINNYYIDMHDTFREMYRVLKPGRMTCIIIGDTQYKNVRIKNMEVSKELLESVGFKIKKIIKRKLSSKIFTPYRDKDGKFTDSNHGKKRKIYQYEYIVVARKI